MNEWDRLREAVDALLRVVDREGSPAMQRLGEKVRDEMRGAERLLESADSALAGND
jgi:hypothetical protein